MTKPEQPERAPREKFPLTRREFLRRAGAVGVLSVIPAKSIIWDTHQIEVTRHKVPLPGLPKALDGLRVVQMSDFHRGRYVGDDLVTEAARTAMSLHPDLILLTGDFVSRWSDYIYPCVRCLSRMSAPLGIYGVLGNHDNWTSPAVIVPHMNIAGMPLLVNESRMIAPGLWLAGVNDLYSGHSDVRSALKWVPKDEARIFMTHNPSVVDDLDGPMLVLAGHTHGGQINLGRWVTSVVTTDVTKHGRFISGWYKEREALLYVNRGIGTVGIPARFRCPPEVALFELFAPGAGGG